MQVTFRSVVGSLYYSCHTRPFIIFSVEIMSIFMYNPTKYHLRAVQRILRYVIGTTEFGIWYSKVLDFTFSVRQSSLDNKRST